VFLLSGWQGDLHAAIPGIPDPPRPGPAPAWWVLWSNDAFGAEIGNNPDDFRTNAFSLGWRFRRDWIAGLDHSALTNRGDTGNAARSDELTITLGRVLLDRHDDHSHAWLAAGVGLRFAGDFGGQDMQDASHETFDFRQVELPYEDRDWSRLLWYDMHWFHDLGRPAFLDDWVLGRGSRFAVAIDQSLLVSDGGELQGSISARGVLAGVGGSLWVGLRQQMRGNKALSHTAEVVADREDGLRLIFGLNAGHAYFEGSTHFDTRLSGGRIGLLFGHDPVHQDAGEDLLVAELGGTLDSYGLTGQVRWQPYWLQRNGSLAKRSSLLLDYRFGRVPGINLDAASLRYQQVLVGWDLAYAPPRDGFQFLPFVSAGVGWRIEDLIQETSSAAVPEAQDRGFVVQGGVGARATWGRKPRAGGAIRYGLSLSQDWWASSGGSERTFNGQNVQLLDDNHSLSLRLLVQLGW